MNDIFPDKFTPLNRTVIGEAAVLLELLGARNLSVGQLYGEFQRAVPTSTYDSFAIALTFLYGGGILEDFHNLIVRVS